MVGDEINRASPKTQSALLEAMEERQVTVDNATYMLEKPFMVIATQNPIEMEGTYALPEAQRDRFMARVSVGYPVESAEIAMLEGHTAHNPLDDLEPVTDAGELRKVIEIVGRVHVSSAVHRYAVALTTATRSSNDLHLGASPRATLHLVRAAKAVAATQGRDYVLPDDIHGITSPVLAHRLLPNVEATMSGRTTSAILSGIVESVPVPPTRAAVREALAALTVRGRAFLAAGITTMVAAIIVGHSSVVRIGVLVAVLPLLTAWWVGRSRYRLALVRTVSPQLVAAGQPATVELTVSNESRTPTGVLLLEERLPYVLGTRPRFVLEGLGHGWRRHATYVVRSELRGQFEIGPMSVRVTDPFGLVELGRTFHATARLTVTPRTITLPTIPLGGAWTGSGDNRPRAFATGSAEDVTVREYRRGDDLRRVHWRSSARVGELMVRREEQPWQSRATVFLDNRGTVAPRPGRRQLPRGRRLGGRVHRGAPHPPRLHRPPGHRLGRQPRDAVALADGPGEHRAAARGPRRRAARPPPRARHAVARRARPRRPRRRGLRRPRRAGPAVPAPAPAPRVVEPGDRARRRRVGAAPAGPAGHRLGRPTSPRPGGARSPSVPRDRLDTAWQELGLMQSRATASAGAAR